jgi:thioredoxin reductase (NADPH)
MSSRIRNYLGFPGGITGDDLTNRSFEQAWLFGADFVVAQAATGLDARGRDRVLRLADGSQVAARAVIVATGQSWRRLGIPRLEELTGAGVFYGSSRAEAHALRGQDVFVVGGGNSAGQAALDVAERAASVTLLVRGEVLGATMSAYLVREIDAAPNIFVRTQTEVFDGIGTAHLEGLVLRDVTSGEQETVPAGALFVMIGAQPHTEWLGDSVERDELGFILTGRDLIRSGAMPAEWPLDRPPLLFEASLPGVFAAGDVRHGSVKRVASAVGGGAIAIQLAHEYLIE